MENRIEDELFNGVPFNLIFAWSITNNILVDFRKVGAFLHQSAEDRMIGGGLIGRIVSFFLWRSNLFPLWNLIECLWLWKKM